MSAPGQRLKSGRDSESADSPPLEQWPVTRPLARQIVDVNSHKEKVEKQVFIRRKKSTCE